MRRWLVVLPLALAGCPSLDIDALTYPCAEDGDCPAAQACDLIDTVCVAPASARPLPEARPATDAWGQLLGLGVADGRFVRWYARGAFTQIEDLTQPDDGTGAFAHDLTEVVAVAKADGLPAYTFFADQRLARGPLAAPDREPLGRYEAPAGVVGIAMAPDGSTVTWLDDDTVVYGTPEDLGAGATADVTWPVGKHAANADAFALAADGTAWVLFRDGTVASGTPEELTRTVRPGRLVGFDISTEPRTFLYYATGWCKVLLDDPFVAFKRQSEPWSGDWAATSSSSDWLAERWITLPEDRRPDEILDVSMGGASTSTVHVYFHDAVRVESMGPFDFTGARSFTNLSPEVTPEVVGMGQVAGVLYTYVRDVGVYRSDHVALPIPPDVEPVDVVFPEGQSFDTIAAIAGEQRNSRPRPIVGAIWAIFTDGSIAEGRSFDFRGDAGLRDIGYRSIDGD
ncbi:MAG: hypothetical protein RMA76_11095 [Deltaproteobacteria bacterium]|jgi:hypothetical protein